MTKKNLYIMAGIIGIILLLVIIVITRNADSNKKAYEAFKEYYNEFYYRHLDDEISTIDCGGQIVMNENGKPILAICDLNLTDERPNAEVYLYEYKDEEVIEIAKATGIETEIEGLYIDVYNGKITMCTEPLGTRNAIVYVLEEYGFNTESIIKAGGLEGYNKENKYNEFWVETRRYTDTPLYIAFYSVLEDEMALNGSDFESILNGLAKVDAKTMLDVKKVYTDYFRVENINRHPEFVYVENDLLYCYNIDEEKLLFEDTIGNIEILEMIDTIPGKIEGIEVGLGSNAKCSQVYELKIEDIESIEYDEQNITIKTKEGEEYKFATTYAYDMSHVYYTEYKVSDGETYEITVEKVKEYFDTGAIKDISLYMERLDSTIAFLQSLTVYIGEAANTVEDVETPINTEDANTVENVETEESVVASEEESNVNKFGEVTKEDRYDPFGNLAGYTTKEFYEGGALHTDYNLEGIKTHAKEYFSVKTGEDAYTLYEKADYYYDTEGNLFETYLLEYDESYKISKQSHYNGSELVSYTLYEYWDNGSLKSSLIYNSSGNLIEEWGYDENGNLTEFETYEY